jgi:hypothetical protein
LFVEDIAYPRSVPTVPDLRDPVHGRKALSLLYGLCHRGAKWKDGRKRPGGKRSRSRLEPLPVDTRVRRGQPSTFAEFLLCSHLGIAYFKATDRKPPRRVDARNPGPFLRLVREVLRLIGAAHISAVELIDPRRKRKRSRADATVNE